MREAVAVSQRVAFIQLEKFDATTNEFAGTMVTETPDESGEIFDYATSKPEVKKWMEAARKRSGGKSLGNVREMHSLKAAGKLTWVEFDDEGRKIRVRGVVTNAETRLAIAEGVLTGLSIGGKYLKTWPDPENPSRIRYTAGLSEVSFVDSPCVEDATLELTTATGTKVLKFSHLTTDDPLDQEDTAMAIEQAVTEAKQLRKAAAKEKRLKKRARWNARAQAVGIAYRDLTKAERREFRARYRVDRALKKLAKVIGGAAQPDVDGVRNRESSFSKAAGAAADDREPDPVNGTRPRLDHAANAARLRRSL